jgi:ATP-dependent protease ClpP protease subunit
MKTRSKSTKEFDFYIRGDIECFEDYDDLIKEFSKVSSDDSVVIYLNTPGGDCSVGFFIIDQIIQLPCPVHMVVQYPTYSMGAIMALCGDALTIQEDAYIMFHDYSGGSRGKGEETADYVNNYRKVFKDRFNRICTPFLTKKESEKMFEGKDIYIHHDDPSLESRCKRHFK